MEILLNKINGFISEGKTNFSHSILKISYKFI